MGKGAKSDFRGEEGRRQKHTPQKRRKLISAVWPVKGEEEKTVLWCLKRWENITFGAKFYHAVGLKLRLYKWERPELSTRRRGQTHVNFPSCLNLKRFIQIWEIRRGQYKMFLCLFLILTFFNFGLMHD